MKIYGGDKVSTYEIIVGKDNLKFLDISCVGSEIYGNFNVTGSKISGVSAKLKGSFFSDEFVLDGTKVEISGELISKRLKLMELA